MPNNNNPDKMTIEILTNQIQVNNILSLVLTLNPEILNLIVNNAPAEMSQNPNHLITQYTLDYLNKILDIREKLDEVLGAGEVEPEATAAPSNVIVPNLFS